MAVTYPSATEVIPASGYYARAKPDPKLAFSVIHITANLAVARNQAIYAARPGSGVTSTFYVDRDGKVVQGLADPERMAPWSNGLWQSPDVSNPRIQAAFKGGVNPNLRTLISIENVGLEPGSPITDAQIKACGALLKYWHDKIGMPVTRETVIGHYQITSKDRPNCPQVNKSVIDKMVAAANGSGGGSGSGGGTKDMNIMTRVYPWPRAWYTKGGELTGYKLSSDPNITRNFKEGSYAPSSAEVRIEPLPPEWGWPAGPYQLVSEGPLKGCLVANSQIRLGEDPVPLPAEPSPTPPPGPDPDCSPEEVAAAQAQIKVLKGLIENHAKDVTKPERELLMAAGITASDRVIP